MCVLVTGLKPERELGLGGGVVECTDSDTGQPIINNVVYICGSETKDLVECENVR